MTSEESADEPRDALALSGLRRMVLHARDQIRSATIPPSWTYASDAWSAAQVKRHASMVLAEQVLTLVAECIPGDGTVSLDEAEERSRTEREAAAARDRRRAQQIAELSEQTTKLTGQVELLQAERDEAQEQWASYEEAEARLLGKLDRMTELAKTDVPAAIRLLTEDEPTS